MMGFKHGFLLVLVGLVGQTAALFESIDDETMQIMEQAFKGLGDSGQMQKMVAPTGGRKLMSISPPEVSFKHGLMMIDSLAEKPPQEWVVMLNKNYDWIQTLMTFQGIQRGPEVSQPEVVNSFLNASERLLDAAISKKTEFQMVADGYTMQALTTVSSGVLRNILGVLNSQSLDETARDILSKLFEGEAVTAEEMKTLQGYSKIYHHISTVGDTKNIDLEEVLTAQNDAEIIKEYELNPKSGVYGTHRPQADPELYAFLVEKKELTMPIYAALTQRYRIPDDEFASGFTDADREAKRAAMHQLIRRLIDPEVQQRFFECQHFDESIIMSLVAKGVLPPILGNIVQLGAIGLEQIQNTLLAIQGLESEFDDLDLSGVVVAGQFISARNVKHAVGKYARIVNAARILEGAKQSAEVEAIDEVFKPLSGMSLGTVIEKALVDFSDTDEKTLGAACLYILLVQTKYPNLSPEIAEALSRVLAVWKPVQIISPESMSRVYAHTSKNHYADNFKALIFLSNSRGVSNIGSSPVLASHFAQLANDQEFMKSVIPGTLVDLFYEGAQVVSSLSDLKASTTGEILGFAKGVLETLAEPKNPIYEKLMAVYEIRQEVNKKLRGSA